MHGPEKHAPLFIRPARRREQKPLARPGTPPRKGLTKSPTEKLLKGRAPSFHVKKHSLVFRNETETEEEETQRQRTTARMEESFLRQARGGVLQNRQFLFQRNEPDRESRSGKKRGIFYDDPDSSNKDELQPSKPKSSQKNFVDTFCENTFRQQSKKKQQFTFKKSTAQWLKANGTTQLLSLDSREINNFRSSDNSDKLLTSKRNDSKNGGRREVYDNIVLSIRDISQSRSSRTSRNRDTLRSHRRLKFKENINREFSSRNPRGGESGDLYQRIRREESQLRRLNGNKFSFEAAKESGRSSRSQQTKSVSCVRSGRVSRRREGFAGQSSSFHQPRRNVNVSDYLKVEKKKEPRVLRKRKKKLSIETKNPHLVNQTWNMDSYPRLSEDFVPKNNFTFKSKKKIKYENIDQTLKPKSQKTVTDMRPNLAKATRPHPFDFSKTLAPGQLKPMPLSREFPETMTKTLEADMINLQNMGRTRQRFYSSTYERSADLQEKRKKRLNASEQEPKMVSPLKQLLKGKGRPRQEGSIILSIKDLTPKNTNSVNLRKQDLKRLLLSNDKSTPCFERCLSTKSIHKTPKVRPKKLFKSNKKMSFRNAQGHFLKESASKLVEGSSKPSNVIVYSRSKKKRNKCSISRNDFETIKKRTSNERASIKPQKPQAPAPKKGIHSKRISSMLQNVEQSNKEIYSRLKQFENDYRNLTSNKGRTHTVYNPSFRLQKDVFPRNFDKEIEKINLDFRKKERSTEKKDSSETLHRETDLMNSSDLLSNRSNKIFTWAPKSNENSQILNSLIKSIPITESYKSKELHPNGGVFKIQEISNYNYNHKPNFRPGHRPKASLHGNLSRKTANPASMKKTSKFPHNAKNFSKLLNNRKKSRAMHQKSKNSLSKGLPFRTKESDAEGQTKENELRKLLRKNRRTPKTKAAPTPKENLFSEKKFNLDWLPKQKYNSYNKYSSLNRSKKVFFQRKNESLYQCVSPLLGKPALPKKHDKKECICCSNWRYNFNHFLHKKA